MSHLDETNDIKNLQSCDVKVNENLSENTITVPAQDVELLSNGKADQELSHEPNLQSQDSVEAKENIQNVDPDENVNNSFNNGLIDKSCISTTSDSNIQTSGLFTNLTSIENIDTDLNNDKEATSEHTSETVTSSEQPSTLSSSELLHEVTRTSTNLDRNCIIELASSTVSLNEALDSVAPKASKLKTSLSKSVDNISTANTEINYVLKSNENDLDPERILNEYQHQKNKVGATQKIVSEQPLDHHIRLPKELSQDLGSIVKNVHGIFSSVSGSLKNAYNLSQNRATQKTTAKPPKSLGNNKIIDDIFEESPEKTTNPDTVQNDCTTEPKSELESLNKEDFNHEDPNIRIDALEKVIAEQTKELSSLNERVKQQNDEMKEKEHLFKEAELKMEMLRKRTEHAERERESTVMKYASRECAIIEAQRASEGAARGEKAARGEVELMQGKLRTALAERERICQLYDDKNHELLTMERELSRVREDMKELEGRLKWTQSKLRMEMDAYKESAEKVEKLQQLVSELEAAKSEAVAGAADSARAKVLETDLQESQAALILCRHEKLELEKKYGNTAQTLEVCTKERDDAVAALSRSNNELSRLRECNARLEEEAAELASLRAQAALAETLGSQLHRVTERAKQAEEALSKEQAQAETCRKREAAALQHVATLSERHAQLIANNATSDKQMEALTMDNTSLRSILQQLEEEAVVANKALQCEVARRNSESKLLARKVAELTGELEEVNKKLEWERGENFVLKKKHASAIKELNRELQRALKRSDQLEAKLNHNEPESSTRTGSVSSLSSNEMAPPCEVPLQNGHASDSTTPEVQAREPDKQTLIERIVSLQRANARRAERCDFLEEHCKQLTLECKNKARLLRQLLCSVAPEHCSDEQKRDIVRLGGGGAMAAVWGGEPDGLTPQLSLEMIRRLQATLEDALLKNIMLKENVDTLGKEIARLKSPNAPESTSK